MRKRTLALAVMVAASVLGGCASGGSAFAPLAAGAVTPATPAPTAKPAKSPTPIASPSPMPTASPTPGPLAVAPTAIAVGATNPTSILVNASEAHYAGAITESNTCSGVATVMLIQGTYSNGPTGPLETRQYSVSQTAPGSCSIAFGDDHGGVVNVPVTSTVFGSLTASQTAVAIGNGEPTIATVAISEANYPLAFNKSDTCAGVATVSLAPSRGPSSTLTIAQVAAGTCSITVADDHGGSASVAVASTTSAVIIQSKGRMP